jgi:hypothetical protein
MVPILLGHARQRRLGQGGINGGLARNLPLPRRFGEPMSSFVRLLVKAHDARERDALFG